MIYTKNIANSKSEHLVALVKKSTIAIQLVSVAVKDNDTVDFNFVSELSAPEQTTLQGIADAYVSVTYMDPDEQNGYEENTYNTQGKLTVQIIWESNSKTRKLKETSVTYSGSRVSALTTNFYNGYGVLDKTLTETYTYQGNNLKNISRSWS